MTFGTSHYALKDRAYLQPADKSGTTNACLPPGPVRQTLFSTLVGYTSYYEFDDPDLLRQLG